LLLQLVQPVERGDLVGLLRHIVLTAVSLLCLAKQRQRLKKGAPESGPSNSFASPSRFSSTETSLVASAAGG